MIKSVSAKTALFAAAALLAASLPAPGAAATPQPETQSPQAGLKINAKASGNHFADDTTASDIVAIDPANVQDAPDVYDDATLAFAPVYDTLPGSWIESSFFEVTGLTEPMPISIVGGEYSMDNADYTSQSDTVVNGAWVKVSLTTPDAYGAATTAQLKIGTQVYTFQVVNIAETDLTNLNDMFESPSDDLQLANGEVSLQGYSLAPLMVKDNAPDNILFKIKDGVLTDVDNNSGTANLKFKSNGDSELETVAYTKPDGKRSALLRLTRGNTDVNFDDADSLLPINDPTTNTQKGVFTALNGTTDTKVEIQTDQRKGKLTKPTEEDDYEAWIKQGSAGIQQIGSSGTVKRLNAFTAVGAIYSGETASFSRQGNLRQIRLGSLKGDQSLAGDPLPLGYLAQDTRVPNLNGNVSRLQGATLLSAVKASLDAGLGGAGNISFDASRGLVTYTLADKTYRFVPLGRVLIDLPTPAVKSAARSRGTVRLNRFAASNAASAAGGAFNLAAQGIQLTMAGSLGYFADLDNAVKSYDPSGTLRLQAEGVIRITLGGADYAVMPASEVTQSNVVNAPAILFTGPSGLAFRDRDGAVQTLYAAPGDISALLVTVRQFDPKATVATQPDGTVQVALQGNNYNFKPSMKLSSPPPGKGNLNLWQENNSFFLRYPDNKVQSFKL